MGARVYISVSSVPCRAPHTASPVPGAQSVLEPASELFGAWIPAMDFCSLRGSLEKAGHPSLSSQYCLCDLWLTLGSASGGLKLSFGFGAWLFLSPNVFREIRANPTPLQWASCFL